MTFQIESVVSPHHSFPTRRSRFVCSIIGLAMCCALVATTRASAQIYVPPSGIIDTIAGSSAANSLNDGGPATDAMLSQPYGVAVDASGNVYIADMYNNRIRKVNAATGIITTVAGGNGDLGDGGPATAAGLNGPTGVAVDSNGNIYIADNANGVIRKVTASTGIISTVAGTDGTWGYAGDGGPATAAQLNQPNAVIVDTAGNLYIADTYNNVIRKVASDTGVITTIAGNGACSPQGCLNGGTYSGNGGPATSAGLFWPNGIALDANSNLYIADTYNNVIREVSAVTGIITTVAGNGNSAGSPYSAGYSGDGGPATSATLAGPYSIFVDMGGNLYIADFYNNAVRKVTASTGIISTLAGNGSEGYSGDGGPATGALLDNPTDAVVDSSGNIYIADMWNSVIRVIGGANNTPAIQDRGVVTLTINGQLAASTSYGPGATPATIASGLSSGVVLGASVTLSSASDMLWITATATGDTTNYSYSIQNTQYDSTDFTSPSFPASPITGSLSGGIGLPNQSPNTIYSFVASYDGVGNVSSYTDSVMGAWNFSYDALNRLQTSQNVAASRFAQQYAGDYGCWSYDDFGNRLSQAVSTTPCSGNPTANVWATYNANNQVVSTNVGAGGMVYDAAGDVTYDGANTYLYDAEGRLCAVSNGATRTGYIYDADGTRVAKGSITSMSCDPSANGFSSLTDYVLGPGGEQVTEVNVGSGSSVWQHTNVFAVGKLMATYDGQGLHFYMDDPLGTRRAQTNYAGNAEQVCSSLPFGDQLTCSYSITSPTEHHFTGKERDAESGLDYFGARYYGSSMGRWMSPDWSAKVEPVPYSKLDDPQTLNLYGYVLNNPLSKADPDGHCCLLDDLKQIKTDLVKASHTLKAKVEFGVGFEIKASAGPASAKLGVNGHVEMTSAPKGTTQAVKIEAGAEAKVGEVKVGQTTGVERSLDHHLLPNGPLKASENETDAATGVHGADVGMGKEDVKVGFSEYDGLGGGGEVSVNKEALNKVVDDVKDAVKHLFSSDEDKK